MDDQELHRKIRQSLEDGFTSKEVLAALRSEGYNDQRIRQAIDQIQQENSAQADSRQNSGSAGSRQQSRVSGNRQTGQPQNQQPSQARQQQGIQQQTGQNQPGQGSQQMQGVQRQRGQQSSARDVIPGVNLEDSYYKIKQRLFLRRYKILDRDGNLVLKAKKKLFKLKEDMPFKDPDGNVLFRLKARSIIDRAGTYDLVREQDGENLAVVDRKFTLIAQSWRIREPGDERLVATVKGKSKILEFLRKYGGMIPILPNIFALVPHKYIIRDVDENEMGRLKGKLSIRDRYELDLQDNGELPHEAMIASVIAIDALEGN